MSIALKPRLRSAAISVDLPVPDIPVSSTRFTIRSLRVLRRDLALRLGDGCQRMLVQMALRHCAAARNGELDGALDISRTNGLEDDRIGFGPG